ncbi:MAG TPA: CaiB/BaiF CoA-transferase family protein [Azospirillum sp.]|nr:CaiB/BaiF CoA-transferase family protein [Azospirillum sp.]
MMLPLDDVLVVDFSRLLPGPWSTQALGDLGARVVKVEQRGVGDPSRHNPPGYRSTSAYFHGVNGNKRSLSLDLASAAGRGVAHRLLRKADVVVESFRPSVAAKLGVGYETARALKPDVIYCSITGFGQTGPLADVPGHDLVIQATAGILSSVRGPDGVPVQPSFQAGDYAAAAAATTGILAALRRRDRGGGGCRLDIAMFDSLLWMGNIALAPAMARAGGGTGEPAMQVWGGNPRYALYPTRDGKAVAVCLLEARLWRGFCEAIGRPDLIDEDEGPEHRHSDHGERSALYRDAIAELCLANDRDALCARMTALGLAVMPVLDGDEVLASENAHVRGAVASIDDPREGCVPALRAPFGAAGLTRPHRFPAPAQGSDSDGILEELGYGRDERAALRAAGIV